MIQNLLTVFKSLHEDDVKYVVIGGIAAILHGVPRSTFDLDLLIEATLDNAEKTLQSFLRAGLGTADMTTAEEILNHEITIFKDIVRIDLQTKTPGINFSHAWERKVCKSIKGVPIYLLCKDDLIASKRAAGRPVDLEDIRLLALSDDSEAD